MKLDRLALHDFVGDIEFTLHEVVTARDQILIKHISGINKNTMIEILGEDPKEDDEESYQLIMTPVLELTLESTLRNEMIQMQILQKQDDNSKVWKLVYKSEIRAQIP